MRQLYGYYESSPSSSSVVFVVSDLDIDEGSDKFLGLFHLVLSLLGDLDDLLDLLDAPGTEFLLGLDVSTDHDESQFFRVLLVLSLALVPLDLVGETGLAREGVGGDVSEFIHGVGQGVLGIESSVVPFGTHHKPVGEVFGTEVLLEVLVLLHLDDHLLLLDHVIHGDVAALFALETLEGHLFLLLGQRVAQHAVPDELLHFGSLGTGHLRVVHGTHDAKTLVLFVVRARQVLVDVLGGRTEREHVLPQGLEIVGTDLDGVFHEQVVDSLGAGGGGDGTFVVEHALLLLDLVKETSQGARETGEFPLGSLFALLFLLLLALVLAVLDSRHFQVLVVDLEFVVAVQLADLVGGQGGGFEPVFVVEVVHEHVRARHVDVHGEGDDNHGIGHVVEQLVHFEAVVLVEPVGELAVGGTVFQVEHLLHLGVAAGRLDHVHVHLGIVGDIVEPVLSRQLELHRERRVVDALLFHHLSFAHLVVHLDCRLSEQTHYEVLVVASVGERRVLEVAVPVRGFQELVGDNVLDDQVLLVHFEAYVLTGDGGGLLEVGDGLGVDHAVDQLVLDDDGRLQSVRFQFGVGLAGGGPLLPALEGPVAEGVVLLVVAHGSLACGHVHHLVVSDAGGGHDDSDDLVGQGHSQSLDPVGYRGTHCQVLLPVSLHLHFEARHLFPLEQVRLGELFFHQFLELPVQFLQLASAGELGDFEQLDGGESLATDSLVSDLLFLAVVDQLVLEGDTPEHVPVPVGSVLGPQFGVVEREVVHVDTQLLAAVSDSVDLLDSLPDQVKVALVAVRVLVGSLGEGVVRHLHWVGLLGFCVSSHVFSRLDKLGAERLTPLFALFLGIIDTGVVDESAAETTEVIVGELLLGHLGVFIQQTLPVVGFLTLPVANTTGQQNYQNQLHLHYLLFNYYYNLIVYLTNRFIIGCPADMPLSIRLTSGL